MNERGTNYNKVYISVVQCGIKNKKILFHITQFKIQTLNLNN